MLSYKNRLINRKDFTAVYRYGNFFSFGELSLKVKRNQLGITRIGLSIGLKFSKKAVERNKIKRQLRAIIHQGLDQVKPGFDIVVMIQRKRKIISNSSLTEDWEGVLKRGKLIIK